ncbi:MAG: aminotransferase class IV [Pseudomonadota bacterium]
MDNQYLPIAKAKISVSDFGLLHSDAIYDVVHVWKGAFFRLDDHLDRFFAGLEKPHMSIQFDKEPVIEILHNSVALSGLRNSYVEFICTHGMSPTFSRDPRDAINQFIAFAIPFGSVASSEQLKHGLHAAVTGFLRIPPESVDPTVKNYHCLDLVKGLYAAYDRGADTAILIDGNGNVSEGPGFNIFAVKDGKVTTPGSGVLKGITRQTVFDICKAIDIDCQPDDIYPALLKRSDEVFITSTAGGVMPVTRIDGQSIGSGVPGEKTGKISDVYWKMHEDEAQRLVVRYASNR